MEASVQVSGEVLLLIQIALRQALDELEIAHVFAS